MTETRIHPETGELLRRDVRLQTVSYGGRSETVLVPGWYPESDGDSVHTGADFTDRDAVFVRLRALAHRDLLLKLAAQAERGESIDVTNMTREERRALRVIDRETDMDLLARSPGTRAKFEQAIKQLDEGRGFKIDLDDV